MPPKKKASKKATKKQQQKSVSSSPEPAPKKAGKKRAPETKKDENEPEIEKKVKKTSAYSWLLETDPKYEDFPENAEYDPKNPPPKIPYQETQVPIDETLLMRDQFGLYCKKNQPYSAKMQFSSMVANTNSNKFYMVQILYDKAKPHNFHVFKRWGRTGEPGYQALIGPVNEQKAIEIYNERVYNRTIETNYELIKTQLEDENEKEETKTQDKTVTNTSKQDSTLDSSVQNLMNLIYDMKVQQKAMADMGYDPKKCPLGKLADESILDGYKVLNKIMLVLKARQSDERTQLEELSSQFYSKIPHDFGRKKMKDFILDDEEKVNQKLNMLQSLTDMKIASNLSSQASNPTLNLIDQNYKKLNCNIKTLTPSSQIHKDICQFIKDGSQKFNADITDIFEIERPGEQERYNGKIGNKMLLWHGSRVSNYVGILSQGLRIAPPEAPVSGYLYGKGIYLADMFDKSAHYCRGGTQDGTILIMLIEGALGKQNVLSRPDSNAQALLNGKHSTFGEGQYGPHSKNYKKLQDGTVIPLGKCQRTASSTYMGHNEYIVYNINQAQIKYLIRCKL